MRGRFITVEGIEGVGKSTHLKLIESLLQAAGLEVVLTREPGGTPVAEAIRRVLLDTELPAMHSDTELMLMFAARAEHLRTLIEPALQRGAWVVCDRFTDATYAYQGGGRGLDTTRIAALESWVQGALRPDYTLLLDTDVETGLSRARNRGAAADRFEQETVDFFERIRAAYLALAQKEPARFHVVDAGRDLKEVEAAVHDFVAGLLEQAR
ncbi:MAG: dTMP kinase [Gammaproteobacteria bacterium]